MSSVFYNPVINKQNFNRMFGDSQSNCNPRFGNFPRVDIVEYNDSFELFAELTGMTKADVKIIVEDGILYLSGEKKNNVSENENTVITRSERVFGKFERKFKLTEDINPEEIKASFENGLLKITFAKIVPEEPKERIIEVK